MNIRPIETATEGQNRNSGHDMQFWIFSYNRGVFLKNCFDSIRRCAPISPIHIFDDNSDDTETCRILEKLAPLCQIHYPDADAAAHSKHGGLYANMQAALTRLEAADLICFLQDDTQLVRPLAAVEIAAFTAYFQDPTAGFLMPAFMRGCNYASDAQLTRPTDDGKYYLVDRTQSSAGAWYSDIFIARAGNLKQVGWTFLNREPLNEQQARMRFKQMQYLRNPFAAWLPMVPAFRGKKQTLALRWANKRRHCGYYPLQIMSEEESVKFKTRDIRELPFAENFLKTDQSLPQPWIYYPLQGSRALKIMDRLERKMTGWIER